MGSHFRDLISYLKLAHSRLIKLLVSFMIKVQQSLHLQNYCRTFNMISAIKSFVSNIYILNFSRERVFVFYTYFIMYIHMYIYTYTYAKRDYRVFKPFSIYMVDSECSQRFAHSGRF